MVNEAGYDVTLKWLSRRFVISDKVFLHIECSIYNSDCIYIFVITSVLRLLHRICVHCYTYHTTFMHFRYLQLDIFTLINIIYLKYIIICNNMNLSSTSALPPFPTFPPFILPIIVFILYKFIQVEGIVMETHAYKVVKL